jgi:anti-sigma factor RsiW
MNTLTDRLRALPNPTLPRDFTASVLARVEAIERPRPSPVSRPTRSIWAIALGSGLAAASIATSAMSGDALLRVAPLSVGGLGMASSGLGASWLLGGLALYAAGLFSPIRHRPQRETF